MMNKLLDHAMNDSLFTIYDIYVCHDVMRAIFLTGAWHNSLRSASLKS